jgi:hypothetical protein
MRIVTRNYAHGGKLALIVEVGTDANDGEPDRHWANVILANESRIRNVSLHWLESIDEP